MISNSIYNHEDILLPLQNNDKCAQFKEKLEKCNREGVSDELKSKWFYSFLNSIHNMNVINIFKLMGICEVFLMQFVVAMGDADVDEPESSVGGLSEVPIQVLDFAKRSLKAIQGLAEESVKFIKSDILCKISNANHVICTNDNVAISVLVIFIAIVLGIIGYIFTKFCLCVSRSRRRRKRRNRLKKMEEQEQLQAEMLQQQMQHMQMQGEQMRQQLAYQSQMQQAQMQQALMQQAQMQQAQMQQEQMQQEQMRQEQMRQEQMRQAQIHRQDINGYSEASLSHEHSHSEDNFIGLGYQSTP